MPARRPGGLWSARPLRGNLHVGQPSGPACSPRQGRRVPTQDCPARKLVAARVALGGLAAPRLGAQGATDVVLAPRQKLSAAHAGGGEGGGSGERRPRYAQGRTRRTGSCGPPGTHLAPVRCMSSVTTTAPSAVPSPWLPSLADSPSARARFVGGFSDEGLSVAKIEASPPMRPARKSALVGRGRHCQWVALGPTSRRRGGGTDRMQEVARSLRRGAPSPRTGCVARVKVESVGVPHVQRRRAVAAAAHHGRLSAQAFRGLAPQVPAWGIVAGPPAARGA